MPDNIAGIYIAPCGLNCIACYAHVRAKKQCPGCGVEGPNKPTYCQRCGIRLCAELQGVNFCVECVEFPCQRMKRLNKRYTQRYGIDLIADARRMQSVGMAQFLLDERRRWTCPNCGGILSLHTKICSECGKERIVPVESGKIK